MAVTSNERKPKALLWQYVAAWAIYASLVITLIISVLKYVSAENSHKAQGVFIGIGITALSGLLTNVLAAFNTRAQLSATKSNLDDQLKATRLNFDDQLKATKSNLDDQTKATRLNFEDQILATSTNLRDQAEAVRKNLDAQIESTADIAEKQRNLSLELAEQQSALSKEIEFVRQANYEHGLDVKRQIDLLQMQAAQDLERTRDKEKEQATVRLNYLDPLRIAASDFKTRMDDIRYKVNQTDPVEIERKKRMIGRFHFVKEPESADLVDYSMWCNGEGYYAASTIYVTAAYFFYATKTRQEIPQSILQSGDDKQLLKCLDEIRSAFGSQYGIYEILQESVGEYMRTSSGRVMSYKDFCCKMFDKSERAWLLNVLDFFREIEKKRDSLPAMVGALTALINFIDAVINKGTRDTQAQPSLQIEVNEAS